MLVVLLVNMFDCVCLKMAKQLHYPHCLRCSTQDGEDCQYLASLQYCFWLTVLHKYTMILSKARLSSQDVKIKMRRGEIHQFSPEMRTFTAFTHESSESC